MALETRADTGVSRRHEVVVSPDWLEQRLQDPGVRVVEVDVGPRDYGEGHIEGAVLWNIYRDLKDADYRLVGPSAIEPLLARSGIAPGSTVVFYGYGPALGFWLLKLYGHEDARILDCSRKTWQAGGRPWTTALPAPGPTHYQLTGEDSRIRARHGDVEEAIGQPASCIVDVRSEPEYLGERFWPSGGMEDGGRAGHVPGALHQPIDGIYDDRGSFRSPEELARLLAGVDRAGVDRAGVDRAGVDSAGDREVITYCTIGGRAATAWFVLTYLLGRREVRVYDGSWAEWGRMPGKPVATGPEPPGDVEHRKALAATTLEGGRGQWQV